MKAHPPKWADRFLVWYCNPEILEEIQGDAHELYFERLKKEGKASADRKYIWDAIRFCRWSNIRRSSNEHKPGYLGILWNLNVKIALRNAFRNKLVFSVKMVGLSICLAFALLLTGYVINEFTFDQHYTDHDRIYRIGSQVEIEGVITNYAVSPVALADGLAEEIPEVENTCWLMYQSKPVFMIEDQVFNSETAFAASNNFLKVFAFEFVQGSDEALDEPNKIVLTETTAMKFFGDQDPIGQSVSIGWTELEVTAVLRDLPANSHLQFSVLISHDTYEINEGWDNVNAYTYLKLNSGASMLDVSPGIAAVLESHHDDMVSGREQWSGNEIKVYPIIENITSIHLGGYLDEDIASKRNKTNVYILIGVIALFFITGLINFLNLSLAEITANLKKIGILQVFGGSAAEHSKVVATNTIVSILIVIPLTALIAVGGLLLMRSYLFIRIEEGVFTQIPFVAAAGGFLLLFILSSHLNAVVLSRTRDVIQSLKGKLNSKQDGFRARELLLATQLSFSIIMLALIVIIVDQFRYINTVDKGMEDKNTIVVSMRESELSKAVAFSQSLKALGGVKKADVSSYYLDNVETKEFFEIDTERGATKMLVAYMNCGYEYFETMNIRLIEGRNFDRDHNDNKMAYIINETAAREFGWKTPIGKQIRGPLGADRDAGEVIGVVKDFHFMSLHSKIQPLIIFLVNEAWGAQYTYVKMNPIHSADMISRIKMEYNKVYPDTPFEWEYLDLKFNSLYKEDYEIRDVFQVGLVISIFISCLGVFSISALLLAMRQQEMGIRKVIGATGLQLFALHIKSFLKFMLIAIVIAWPAIYYLSKQWLNNFEYHINLNIGYFVFPAMVTLLIILLTSGYHGMKCARVNTVDILKHE